MRHPAVKRTRFTGRTSRRPTPGCSSEGVPGDRRRYSGLEGDSEGPTSGSSGIVGGSGAVSGSCSGIVPGSAGIGSSGVGRSGVVPGSWLAISSLLRLGETHLPSPQPAKPGRRAYGRVGAPRLLKKQRGPAAAEPLDPLMDGFSRRSFGGRGLRGRPGLGTRAEERSSR
jgi:hypothetical protein